MANVVKKHSISSELAQKMVDEAMAKARKIGVTENVAILDDGGNLKAFGRMDGAPSRRVRHPNKSVRSVRKPRVFVPRAGVTMIGGFGPGSTTPTQRRPMGAGPGWAVFERAACPTDEGSRGARRHEITRNRKKWATQSC